MLMSAVSIRQPWAELIICHGKDVENRFWRCPEKYLGKPVLIHAGKTWETVGDLRYIHELKACQQKQLALGGIVGVFVIYANVENSKSKWAEDFPGCVHWLIDRAAPVEFFPCPGRLGFFMVDYPFELPDFGGEAV